MTAPTPNTRRDAAIRTLEDVVVVAGAAVGAWQATHNPADVVAAVVSAPVARSAIASALSKGRVSGVVLALKLVWQALAAVDGKRIPVFTMEIHNPVPEPTAPAAFAAAAAKVASAPAEPTP